MEKLLKPYDKKYMKMAMLKHEETFKEQVYELHRLYQIQKILMKNIDNNSISKGESKVLNLEKPAEENDFNIGESNGDNGVLEFVDESELELTLGPASYNRRRKSRKTLTSDSGPSSSSSTGSSHLNRTSTFLSQYQIRDHMTSDLELSTSCQLGLLQIPDDRSAYQKAIKNTIEIEEGLKQPPWFLQALSFNMA